MTDPYSPSPELVEAAVRGKFAGPFLSVDTWAAATLTAAVAFRHPDGHPELVPWEQVRELVDAAQRVIDTHPLSPAGAGGRMMLRAALAPFTQEPEA